jgi:hypothetical protein
MEIRSNNQGGIMKKLVLIALALLLCAGAAFAEENDSDIILRGAAGIMLITSPSNPNYAFDIYDFRAGVHGDFMYNMGRFEVGGEIGFYAMEIEIWNGWDYDYFFGFEVPINAIVRMNFDKERLFGIEARGGLWLHMAMNEWETITDVTFNVGGRFVLGIFYIGADYLFESDHYYDALVVEAGLKVPFEF